VHSIFMAVFVSVRKEEENPRNTSKFLQVHISRMARAISFRFGLQSRPTSP